VRRGERVTELAPDTICDGLRGLLGAPNFAILLRHNVEVLLADDAATLQAMRLLWQRTKQLVEPSSAIALAAVLAHRERFAGQRVGVVLSGGNVDLDMLASLLSADAS
jgi:threonine dehydratase